MAKEKQPVEEQKEQTKKPELKTTRQAEPYAFIDTFLGTAISMYNLNGIQVSGFKAYMSDKLYLPNETDFIPYLNKYLGKDENK